MSKRPYSTSLMLLTSAKIVINIEYTLSKKLYYSTCAILTPNIGITIDDILSVKGEQDEVYWCYCHKALSACQGNLNGCPSICNFCHSMYKRYAKKYGKGVHMISIDKKDFVHESHFWHFENVDQVKAIKYRGVYIGYGILSLYLSYTRDLDIKNLEGFVKYFTPIIGELCDYVDYVYDLLGRIKPDEIISFNGRLFDNRLFYDIANALGIKYTALEVVFSNGERGKPLKRVRFEGGLPHSIKLNTQMMNDLWEHSPLSEKEKTDIATSFYVKRRGGKYDLDKVYISDQKQGVLPEGFDPNQRNIAIFNSSEDEFTAIGGEWEETIFSSQYEAVDYILQRSSPDIHYYLRIHPHLKGVKYQAHMELYTLSKYKNLTIIPPESEVSTYDLMDACEKVVTFGSTMGVESAFWGKPSILLRRSMYENLDICYQASRKEEVMPLLEAQLDPKPQLGALKFAYYILDREYGIEKSNIAIDIEEKTFLGRTFQFTPYFKIWGSQLFYQIAYFYHCILMPRYNKGVLRFPDKCI